MAVAGEWEALENGRRENGKKWTGRKARLG